MRNAPLIVMCAHTPALGGSASCPILASREGPCQATQTFCNGQVCVSRPSRYMHFEDQHHDINENVVHLVHDYASLVDISGLRRRRKSQYGRQRERQLRRGGSANSGGGSTSAQGGMPSDSFMTECNITGVTGCPPGYLCPNGYEEGGAAVGRVCVPQCATDQDCEDELQRTDVLCTNAGFCTVSCSTNADCPATQSECRGSHPSCQGILFAPFPCALPYGFACP
jgi:hypothetical protein